GDGSPPRARHLREGSPGGVPSLPGARRGGGERRGGFRCGLVRGDGDSLARPTVHARRAAAGAGGRAPPRQHLGRGLPPRPLAPQAVFDVLEEAGWPFDRLIGSGAVPVLTRGDLEYLDAARYGERLDIQTWFSVTPPALLAHQHICRDGRLLVRANTRWGWAAPAGDGVPGPPGGLLPALRPLVVA